MTTETLPQTSPAFNQQRIIPGIVLLVIALLMFLFFVRDTQPGQIATFGMNMEDTGTIPIPDLVLPVQPALYTLIIITVFLAFWQIARGIRSIGWLAGIVSFAFVASFLIWATKDQSFNLVGMISTYKAG